MLAGVAEAWVYLIAVGVGHWHLSRVFAKRPDADQSTEPDAAEGYTHGSGR